MATFLGRVIAKIDAGADVVKDTVNAMETRLIQHLESAKIDRSDPKAVAAYMSKYKEDIAGIAQEIMTRQTAKAIGAKAGGTLTKDANPLAKSATEMVGSKALDALIRSQWGKPDQ